MQRLAQDDNNLVQLSLNPEDDRAKYSYGGKEFDEENGLYYFNARYYDATIGRFINVDPAQDGTNWYVYCNNNPLSFVDPSGLNDHDIVNYPKNESEDLAETNDNSTDSNNRLWKETKKEEDLFYKNAPPELVELVKFLQEDTISHEPGQASGRFGEVLIARIPESLRAEDEDGPMAKLYKAFDKYRTTLLCKATLGNKGAALRLIQISSGEHEENMRFGRIHITADIVKNDKGEMVKEYRVHFDYFAPQNNLVDQYNHAKGEADKVGDRYEEAGAEHE